MSYDGINLEEDNAGQFRNNELREDEQEEMVLEKGNEYKMVSIMR